MSEKLDVEDILNPNLDCSKRIIQDSKKLKEIVTKSRKKGLKIVLTQGVWDLIHEGHVKYLDKAKQEGDILIVGVDSDELTQKRKGPTRPIVPEDERLRMVSYLRCVDIVTMRNADEPLGSLIHFIKPDTLIASTSTEDFKNEFDSVCGKITILEPQATTSSTGRIRLLAMNGAKELAEKVTNSLDDFLKEQESHEQEK